jgi:hypothetical protein
METHKCSECGYLALRENESRALVETEEGLRRDGAAHYHPSRCEPLPLCFARAYDLRKEYYAAPDGKLLFLTSTAAPSLYPEALKHILQKDRLCKAFIEWQQGFSPREHFEMKQLTEQREWQEQRLREDRDWRASQAELERQWRTSEARDRRTEARDRKTQLRILFLALIISIIIPLVTVLLDSKRPEIIINMPTPLPISEQPNAPQAPESGTP